MPYDEQEQVIELAHEVKRLRVLLGFAVLNLGGQLVMTPDDLAESRFYRLTITDDGELKCKTEPRYPGLNGLMGQDKE